MSQSSEFTQLSNQAKSIKIGRYRHFKGGEYKVLGIGKHTETLEEFVVYRSVDKGDRIICLRPVTNFLETIDRDGYHGPRFHYKGLSL